MSLTVKPIVFIIDDDPAILKALEFLVASVGHDVVLFNSAETFLDQFTDDRAGCILTDVRMPGLSGIKLQEELRRRGNAIPVIVMTAHGDVTSAVRAMKAGAVDFIEKPFNDQLLLDQIDLALKKDHETRRARQAIELAQAQYNKLSPREKEVSALVAAGRSSKEIARSLDISPKTVEAHRANIGEKLGVNSIAEITKFHVLCSQASATGVDPA